MKKSLKENKSKSSNQRLETETKRKLTVTSVMKKSHSNTEQRHQNTRRQYTIVIDIHWLMTRSPLSYSNSSRSWRSSWPVQLSFQDKWVFFAFFTHLSKGSIVEKTTFDDTVKEIKRFLGYCVLQQDVQEPSFHCFTNLNYYKEYLDWLMETRGKI